MPMQRRAPEKMDCNLLIQAVFARRALWQRNHKHHHNRGMLDQLWDEVAESIGSTRDGCRRRWKSLKDNFRRELKKSEETMIKSIWPYYDPLLFLKDQMISSFLAEISDPLEIQPQSKLEVFEVSSNDDEKLENELQVQEIDEEVKVFNAGDLLPTTSTTRGRRGRKKRKVVDESESIEDEILTTDEIIPPPSIIQEIPMKENEYESTSDSDDYFFFMSLIPHVQNFSSIQKLRLRNKIQQLIIDEASGINMSNSH